MRLLNLRSFILASTFLVFQNPSGWSQELRPANLQEPRTRGVATGSAIYGAKVIKESPCGLELEVDYLYDGSGRNNYSIAVFTLWNGESTGYLGYRSQLAEKGRHIMRIVLSCTSEAPDFHRSNGIGIDLHDGETRNFNFEKMWCKEEQQCKDAETKLAVMAAAPLEDRLVSAQPSIKGKAEMEMAAFGRKEKEKFAPGIAKWLNDPILRVRLNALRALERMGSSARPAMPDLVRLLKDPQDVIRRCAAIALKNIVRPEDTSAIPALTEALSDKDETTRENAKSALRAIQKVPDSTGNQFNRGLDLREIRGIALLFAGPILAPFLWFRLRKLTWRDAFPESPEDLRSPPSAAVGGGNISRRLLAHGVLLYGLISIFAPILLSHSHRAGIMQLISTNPTSIAYSLVSALLPYAVFYLLCGFVESAPILFGGALALLAASIFSKLYYHLFAGLVSPTVAAPSFLSYVIVFLHPPYSLISVLPLGMAAGWMIGRMRGNSEAPPLPASPVPGRERIHPVAQAMFLAGAGLNVGILFDAPSLLSTPLIAWLMLPYAVCLMLGKTLSDPFALALGGLAVLGGDIYLRFHVFVFPASSTASISLLFSPVYFTGIYLPAGLASGWLIGLLWKSLPGRQARQAAALVGLGLLASAGLAAWIFRAEARIGRPRVARGETLFRKAHAIDKSMWLQVGRFDAEPREMIATRDDSQVTLLDLLDLSVKKELPFTPDVRRILQPTTTLLQVQPEGMLCWLEPGGGYSDVGLLNWEGKVLWRFKPDPRLPPSALIARDLDADGTTEFYSASGDTAYRLDSKGQIVWEKKSRTLINQIDAAPAESGAPAVVVAIDNAQTFKLWDPTGKLVGEFPNAGRDYRFKIIDWPGKRSLVLGESQIEVIDLEGKLVFQFPLEKSYRFQSAIVVRFRKEEDPYLVALAYPANRRLHRWQLLIFSPSRDLVYKEILPAGGALMAASDPRSGGQVLLLGMNGLWKYEMLPGR